jgi:hypothetical protein
MATSSRAVLTEHLGFCTAQTEVLDSGELQLRLVLDGQVNLPSQIDIELDSAPQRPFYISQLRRMYALRDVVARTFFSLSRRLVRSPRDLRRKAKGALGRLGVKTPSGNTKVFFPVLPVHLAEFSGVHLYTQLSTDTGQSPAANINSIFEIHELVIKTSPILIDKKCMQPWENIVALKEYNATGIKLRPVKQISQPPKEVRFRCRPLSGALFNYHWRFVVKAYFGDMQKTAAVNVVTQPGRTLDIDRCGKNNSLTLAVSFLKNSVNFASSSRYTGLPFGLYDLDHRTYRLFHWIWGDALVVSALLAVARLRDDATCQEIAESIADRLLSFQITDRANKNFGGIYAGGNLDPSAKTGFQWSLLPHDASFIARWAWMPIYRLTQNAQYLEAVIHVGNWLCDVLDQFGYLPAWYRKDTELWERRVMIDSGFGAEVFRDLFLETDDDRWRDYGIKFIESLLSRLEADDGNYHRTWHENGTTSPIIFSRGQAWVLEGLIAVYEMSSQERYLRKAQSLASCLMQAQKRNGAWNVYTNLASGECDKGTPIIALNLLRLNRLAPNRQLVASAEKAIEWCEEHQHRGPDPNGKGGIYARSVGGGIIPNFPYILGSAPYAVAAFILSMIELRSLRDT